MENSNAIQIGDEVIYCGMKHIVLTDIYHFGCDSSLCVSIWRGGLTVSVEINKLLKTGRHFPQIKEVLKQLEE